MPQASAYNSARLKDFPAHLQGVKIVHSFHDLLLDNGQLLSDYELAYEFWGSPNASRDNFVLIEHALTANSHVTGFISTHGISVPGWWDEVVGPGKAVDTNKYCVIAINTLGGCDGSTGPSSTHPDGKPWGSRFPRVTSRDQVNAEHTLVEWLGIESFRAVIGGSMGGARVLEWSLMYPQSVRSALVLAVSAKASAYMIATQSLQIEAITSDPHWLGGDYYSAGVKPVQGLRIARQIAHLTYRTPQELEERFSNRAQDSTLAGINEPFAVSSYLGYQADKLQARFDAGSYVILTHSLNTHDVGRGRGGAEAALASCTVPTIVAGIAEDLLFPIHEQQFIYEHLPYAHKFHTIYTNKGHDGFLTESADVSALVQETLTLSP